MIVLGSIVIAFFLSFFQSCLWGVCSGPHQTSLKPFSCHVPPTCTHSYSHTLSHINTHSSYRSQWKTTAPDHSHTPPSSLHMPSLCVVPRAMVCILPATTTTPNPTPPSGTHYVGQWLVSADWASGKKNTIISALGYSRKGDKSWYEVWNPKSFSHAEADKLGLICAHVHVCVSKVFTFARFPVLK